MCQLNLITIGALSPVSPLKCLGLHHGEVGDVLRAVDQDLMTVAAMEGWKMAPLGGHHVAVDPNMQRLQRRRAGNNPGIKVAVKHASAPRVH